MADLVNLRTARKQAARRDQQQRASANRLSHGQPKHLRRQAAAEREQSDHILDLHRIEPGDGR